MADERKLIWLPTPALTRRKFIIAGSAAAFLAACGGDDDSASTTAPGTASPGTTATPGTTGAPGTTTGATTAPGGTAPVGIKGGILRVGTLGGSNDLLDGQHIISKADIMRQVTGWEPLFNFNPKYEVVNTDAIAEEIETIAADHYVVRLKEGVMFSDGKPVRAEDVIYSFQRMLDPDKAVFGGGALRAGLLDPTGVTKVDDRSVDFKLKQLAANFSEFLCAYTTAIVPEGYERFAGDPTNQIGTGAYKLQEFEVGVQSIHTRNEYYWETGKPYFDEVHIIDFADSDAMVNALLADQLDCCQDIPATAVDTLKNQDFGVLNAAGGGWLTIFMAVDQEPFTDVRVRQAMRLIVDRQAMVDQVLGGYGSIANDLFSPLDAAYIGDELPQREQDIEQAKQLLADAGMSDLEIELFAPNDTAGLPELVQAFATMAQDAGINVKPVIMDGSYWGDEYLKRTFGVDYWGTRNFLPQVASSSLPTAPYPDDHWPPAGSTFIEDYNAAVAEVDLAKRKPITDKMQTELYETGGLIIPFFQNQLDGFNLRVKGLVERANTLNLDHYGRGFKNLYFEE
jgi:peptide/nickel transport system substrate-binding protein